MIIHQLTSFQDLSELLETLHEYLTGFLRAQIRYIGVKMKGGVVNGPLEPFIFAFDGEYSIVTNAAIESEVTMLEMFALRQHVQNVLALDFKCVTTYLLRVDGF